MIPYWVTLRQGYPVFGHAWSATGRLFLTKSLGPCHWAQADQVTPLEESKSKLEKEEI